MRLADVAKVSDGVEDVRNIGMSNGNPAILVILYGQPGANVIETVDNVKALLPALQAAIPPSIKLIIANDRTATIRASVHDVETTMTISIVLVVFVVFLFLRSGPRRGAAVAGGHIRRDVFRGVHARQSVSHGAHGRHRLRR